MVVHKAAQGSSFLCVERMVAWTLCAVREAQDATMVREADVLPICRLRAVDSISEQGAQLKVPPLHGCTNLCVGQRIRYSAPGALGITSVWVQRSRTGSCIARGEQLHLFRDWQFLLIQCFLVQKASWKEILQRAMVLPMTELWRSWAMPRSLELCTLSIHPNNSMRSQYCTVRQLLYIVSTSGGTVLNYTALLWINEIKYDASTVVVFLK